MKKMKKWIVIIVILALVVSGLVSFFTSGKAEAPGTAAEEKQETAGTIKVPDGPKIEIVTLLPPELKIDWEELSFDGLQLCFVGPMTNVSSSKIQIPEIAFIADGIQVASLNRFKGLWPDILGPGESTKISTGFPVPLNILDKKSAVIEVEVKYSQKIGNQVVALTPSTLEPTPTKPEPETETESWTPPESIDSFTKMPQNLETSEATLAAFFFLASRGEWKKSIELCVPSSAVPTEEQLKEFFGGRQVKMVKLTAETDVSEYEGKVEAVIPSFVVYFIDGSNELFDNGTELVKVNGEWRIEELE